MDHRESSAALNFTPPSNIIDAMSEIQHYFLVEDSGQPMRKEFFTMTHTMGFAKVGITSALMDSIVWVVGYVFVGAIIFYVQENYLTERTTQLLFWTVNGSPLYWFAKLASFGMLLFSTVMCVLMSRYYTGTVPKRAINTLLTTRAMFLVSFSLISFILLGLLYKYLMNDQVIDKIYLHIAQMNAPFAEKIYYFLHNYFRRMLFESGITALIASTISVIVPFFSISYFRFAKKRKRDLGIIVK